MNPLDAFERCLESLYEAALDDARWPAATVLIEEALDASGNALSVIEGDDDDDARVTFSRFLRRGDSQHDLMHDHFTVYHPHDEAMPRARQLPHGRLVHVRELYTEDELKTSVVYNEGLARLESQNSLYAQMHGPDSLRVFWALADPDRSRVWETGQLRLMERLLPHIHRAVLIRQALAAADALGSGLTGLLDNDRIGAVQLDRGGRVLAANAPALEILRRGDGLSDRDGALDAVLPADRSRLRRLLGQALPVFLGDAPSGGSMTIQRPSGRSRLGLHVSPVGDGQADFGARRVAALVLVVDPARRPRIDPVRVATMLGLTPSEGRVAALLAEGRPAREIAAATGYQESYVYWLLKQVYKKQGLSGQIALVQRVLTAYAFPHR